METTYRVFKEVKDSSGESQDPVVWCEHRLTVEQRYGSGRLTAQELGDALGEGRYLYVEGASYLTLREITVVSRVTYDEAVPDFVADA